MNSSFLVLWGYSSRYGYFPAEIEKFQREMRHPFHRSQAEMEKIYGDIVFFLRLIEPW